MNYAILDETTLLKTIYEKISEIGIPVLFEHPNIRAKFPVIILRPPMSRPGYMGASWDISATVEVWGNRHFDPSGEEKETADYFTELKVKMLELNFQCVAQIPAFTDIEISKIRYGGYFEARWNSTANTFERNG